MLCACIRPARAGTQAGSSGSDQESSLPCAGAGAAPAAHSTASAAAVTPHQTPGVQAPRNAPWGVALVAAPPAPRTISLPLFPWAHRSFEYCQLTHRQMRCAWLMRYQVPCLHVRIQQVSQHVEKYQSIIQSCCPGSKQTSCSSAMDTQAMQAVPSQSAGSLACNQASKIIIEAPEASWSS